MRPDGDFVIWSAVTAISVATPFPPIQILVIDFLMALVGGWGAMTLNSTLHEKLWAVTTGILFGMGAAFILRETALNEWAIRLAIVVVAIAGIEIAQWIKNPQQGADQIKAALSALNEIRKSFALWLGKD